ncbi:hypothetical protein G210_4820, partial [Candida maltosa Xu316]
MLRREATTIKLSPEDILEYDESRETQKLKQQQAQQQQQQQQQANDLEQQQNSLSDFTPRTILQEQINNSSQEIVSDFKEESSSVYQRSRPIRQSSRDERIGIQRN